MDSPPQKAQVRNQKSRGLIADFWPLAFAFSSCAADPAPCSARRRESSPPTHRGATSIPAYLRLRERPTEPALLLSRPPFVPEWEREHKPTRWRQKERWPATAENKTDCAARLAA